MNPRLRKPKARVPTLARWKDERASLSGPAILKRNLPNPHLVNPKQKPLRLPRFRGKRYSYEGKR